MAVTYTAAEAGQSDDRRVFAGTAAEGLVIKSDDSIPRISLIAVTTSIATAQEIVNALNGGA